MTFLVDGADFDGTNDFIYRNTTFSPAASASSKQGIFACRFTFDVTPPFAAILLESAPTSDSNFYIQIAMPSDNKLYLFLRDAARTLVLQFNTSALALGSWHRILASWDCAIPALNVYVDGAPDKNGVTQANLAMNWSGLNDTKIGARYNSTFPWDGGIAECYFAPGQYLDFSSSAQRLKFENAGGFPVSLGTDGSTPTGTAPLFYCHLDADEAPANFALNRAGSGHFSITGNLTTRPTSPSDGQEESIQESFIVVDQPQATLESSGAVSEAVTASDAVASGIVLGSGISEAFTPTDAVGSAIAFGRDVAETFSLSSTVDVRFAVTGENAESLAFVDAVDGHRFRNAEGIRADTVAVGSVNIGTCEAQIIELILSHVEAQIGQITVIRGAA